MNKPKCETFEDRIRELEFKLKKITDIIETVIEWCTLDDTNESKSTYCLGEYIDQSWNKNMNPNEKLKEVIEKKCK